VKKVLVPLDGSKLSEEALVPALEIAKRHRASVELVHIVPELAPVSVALPGPEPFAEWLEKEQVRSREYLEQLKDTLGAPGGVNVSTHVQIGFVAESIQDFANRLGVDLVVLTSHGHGRWERLWIGSVADRLLRSAEQPMLLLRPGEQRKAFASAAHPRHILVPLDGTHESEGVLEVLRDIWVAGSSRLTLVSAYPQPTVLFPADFPEPYVAVVAGPERERFLQNYLRGVKGRLEGLGFAKVDWRVVQESDVARCLLRIAKDEDVDLIALSTHGRRGVDRLLLGSVVDKLVRGSDTAVLTVRRREEDG
jgi:nucleotide-binding universal stress UspA family protein